MARNIRWQVTFKSLNGTTYNVNIYDKDWPAGVVMPVRGAADPFFYDEDDSDDILNSVIRYRTGYIRVIEDVYGTLDDIYPTNTFDRYVECVSGGTVIFNGYIQVQDFQRPLKPGPRILELPVISPLGLFDKRTFMVTQFNPPASVTLGELLDIVMESGTYEKVTFPDIANTGFDKEIYSLVVCPYNPDHHYSTPYVYADDIFRPETYAYLIEAICKAYGWICHDTPNALVFTSFDYKGLYAYYEKGHIGETNYKRNESVSQAEEDLSSHYTPADANATMRKLIPDTGIEVDYEGGSLELDFSFERTYFHSVKLQTATDYRELTSFCNLTAATQLQEITGCGALDFQSDKKIAPGCAIVAWNGNEGILRSFSDVLSSGTELFRIRFYTKYVPDRSYSVKYDVMTSEWDIAELENDTNEDTLLHFSTTITTTRNYVEVQFVYNYGTYVAQKFPDNYLVFFHNIALEIYDDDEPYTEYRLTPASKGDVIPSTGNPAISSSITMPISLYRNNDRMIGDTLLTQKVTEYPYLFQPRMEMQGTFRGTGIPNLYHAMRWGYLNKLWRIIAMDFHARNDEYRLTMQSSPVLDGGSVPSYTIIATALHTSLSGYTDTVDEGESFTHQLTADSGWEIGSVTILMANEDITSTAYDSSTGAINISSVTGNVSILVVAEQWDALTWDTKHIYSGTSVNSTLTYGTSSNYDCMKVPCQEGDVFKITGHGASSYRLYAWLNTQEVVIQIAASNTTKTDFEVTTPVTAAYLVVNAHRNYTRTVKKKTT